MKRLFYLISAVILIFQITAFSQTEKNEIDFKPVGGGRFIYCNNREELIRADLADDGENPSYIMSNRALTPDNYRLYVTHFTRIPKLIDEESYPGEEIWFDGVFTAKTDCKIVLKKTAFEIPQNREAYLNHEIIRSEDSWSALYACADLLGKPIHLLNSHRVFEPRQQTEKVITIAAGDRVFLSDYIENYAPVPYPKHVMLGADFEIISGKTDLDIFAAKTRIHTENGAEYPDIDFENCGFGVYKRDRTVKGIADSLPEMKAKLEYTIDDGKRDGSELGVRIKNQYYPKAHGVTAWVTNLNPQADKSVRNLNVESSILPLEYFDPSKKTYYGSDVPEKFQSDIWYFDTKHSDTAEFTENLQVSEEEYEPNYVISSETEDLEHACNLGNYGVTLRYELTVTNAGLKDRYFDYVVTTAANVIVEVTDKNGEPLAPVIARGQTSSIEKKTLASVLLPAGKTTEFSIGITLPVQNFGGQRQSFVINSEKTENDFSYKNWYEPDLVEPIQVHNDERSEKLLEKADEKTKEIFAGNLANWKIAKFNKGYAAYYTSTEGSAYLYGYYWNTTSKVLILDEDFCITRELNLGSQPIEMSVAGGRLYIKTIANGSFVIDEGSEPEAFDSYTLPQDNNAGEIILAKNNALSVSFDGKSFYKIAFEGEMPLFAQPIDGGFYGASGAQLWVSRDGMYWTYEKLPEGTLTNAQLRAVLKSAKTSPVKIRLNDMVLAFSEPPIVMEESVLVPARFVLEQLDMQVLYNAAKRQLTAVSTEGFLQFTIDSDKANVNGKTAQLSAPVQIIGGRTLVPIDALGLIEGFSVTENDELIEIDGDAGKRTGELELLGDVIYVMPKVSLSLPEKHGLPQALK